jgi:hypothetical protein
MLGSWIPTSWSILPNLSLPVLRQRQSKTGAITSENMTRDLLRARLLVVAEAVVEAIPISWGIPAARGEVESQIGCSAAPLRWLRPDSFHIDAKCVRAFGIKRLLPMGAIWTGHAEKNPQGTGAEYYGLRGKKKYTGDSISRRMQYAKHDDDLAL